MSSTELELVITEYAHNGTANLLFYCSVDGVYCGACKYINGISGFCFHFGKLEANGATWKRKDSCLNLATRTAMILEYAHRYHASLMAKQAALGRPINKLPPWEELEPTQIVKRDASAKKNNDQR